MTRFVLAAAALLALTPLAARAEEPATLPVDAVVDQAIKASELAGSQASSPIDVKGRGDGLRHAVERTRAGRVESYKWAVEKDLRDTIASDDPKKMINAAAKNLKPDGISVPGPRPADGLDQLKRMDDDGRVKTGQLAETTLGIYHSSTNDPVGVITASRRTMQMCTLIGYKLCAAVLFHEVGHALDEMLHQGLGREEKEDMARVVREETAAFAMMQRYLRGIYASDREGHEIFATTLMRLEAEQKIQPHPARTAAISFIRTCNEVYSAIDTLGRPDQAKLEKIVLRLYKADGSPASASA